jgi:hypothetical protein
MPGKQSSASSDSFSWYSWFGTPTGRQPHLPRLNFCQKSRQRLAPGLRSGLYALAFLLSGALLFISVGLCALVVLANNHCGPRFGYVGCEIRGEVRDLNTPRNGALVQR